MGEAEVREDAVQFVDNLLEEINELECTTQDKFDLILLSREILKEAVAMLSSLDNKGRTH